MIALHKLHREPAAGCHPGGEKEAGVLAVWFFMPNFNHS